MRTVTGQTVADFVRARVFTPEAGGLVHTPRRANSSYHRAVSRLTHLVNLIDQLARHADARQAQGEIVEALTIQVYLRSIERLARQLLKPDPSPTAADDASPSALLA